MNSPVITLSALCAIVSGLVSYGLLRYLLKHPSTFLVLDVPNPRSLHSDPVLRGGGISIVLVTGLLGFLPFWYFELPVTRWVWIALPILPVVILGWFDDRYNLTVQSRILVQSFIACGFLLLLEMPTGLSVLGYTLEIPWGLMFVGLLLWLAWMINLFNFMDGLDGLVATQSLIGAMTLALWFYSAGATGLMSINLILGGSLVGFLILNWYPAKIFLGDIGSLTLGAYFAAMAIIGWNQHQMPVEAFLLVYGVMLFDSSITLLRRIFKGERWWEAHSSHFYQRAVRLGYNHAQVSGIAMAMTLLLAGFASLIRYDVGPSALWVVLGASVLAGGIFMVKHKEKVQLKRP